MGGCFVISVSSVIGYGYPPLNIGYWQWPNLTEACSFLPPNKPGG